MKDLVAVCVHFAAYILHNGICFSVEQVEMTIGTVR